MQYKVLTLFFGGLPFFVIEGNYEYKIQSLLHVPESKGRDAWIFKYDSSNFLLGIEK